jgi:dTDP-glucose 4,6-dehydratase
VTVTHPDAERFFMTVAEACQLVLQATGVGRSGQVLVLDMGEPVRIIDLAKRLAANAGCTARFEITGLRPGEKLTEVLFSEQEHPQPTSHPGIRWVHVPPMAPDAVPDSLPQHEP